MVDLYLFKPKAKQLRDALFTVEQLQKYEGLGSLTLSDFCSYSLNTAIKEFIRSPEETAKRTRTYLERRRAERDIGLTGD